jgi:hypothetical protein
MRTVPATRSRPLAWVLAAAAASILAVAVSQFGLGPKRDDAEQDVASAAVRTEARKHPNELILVVAWPTSGMARPWVDLSYAGSPPADVNPLDEGVITRGAQISLWVSTRPEYDGHSAVTLRATMPSVDEPEVVVATYYGKRQANGVGRTTASCTMPES